MRKIKPVIAIDGPAASGKSTTARLIAEKLGLTYIDSGAMYRAITWLALQQGVPVDDAPNVARLAEQANIEFRKENGHQQVYCNGQNISRDIRMPEIAKNISPVAANENVRKRMVKLQQQMGEKGNIIMDGRDIGTVVFPQADVKIFLNASAEARAKRRQIEQEKKGLASDYEEVLADVLRRDEADRSRSVGPLKKAADAIEVDNSNMTVSEQVSAIMKVIQKKIS